MNLGRQLRDINAGFEIVASYPALKDLPVIIGESDPEGCAACSEADNPHNAYRNGTMYAVYTAAAFSRKYALADRYGTNFRGAVTWAFEFENEPWFAGFRALATNGIDKPVLNVFRMFGMMSGDRVQVTGGTNYELMEVVQESVRKETPDVNALASRGDGQAAIMVWNYHDDHVPAPPARVSIRIYGLPAGRVLLEHYRVDKEYSNSYEAWKAMGSPQHPDEAAYAELERRGQLELLTSPRWMSTDDRSVVLEFVLPREGVSLLKFHW
jgi:xylan 1,4-beta-xylosidase